MCREIKLVMQAVAVFFLLFIASFSHAASVPPLINYQGTLTDAAGQPVANGTKKLTFNIYDTASGGALIWGPQVFTSVPVINGVFNVILGTTDTGGRSIVDAFGASTRYLGISVNDGAEITPRQQVLSTPFAVQAERAERAEQAERALHGDPVGSVQAFMGIVAPEGWLLCNGAAIPVEHQELIQLVGANTPNLKDMFLRGKNDDRPIGHYQADEFRSHNHGTGGYDKANWYGNNLVHAAANTNGGWQTNTTGYAGGSETRPKNIAVNYIIKY